LNDEQKNNSWTKEEARRQGYQAAALKYLGEDINEIKEYLRRIETKLDAQEQRIVCLETQRNTVGAMTKFAAWIGAALGGVVAALEAIGRLK